MSQLIFIDTNILLDFYRFRNTDISLKYLDLIDRNHDKIICTTQIEMEYKKHRAEEIKKTYDTISPPTWQSSMPAILSNSGPANIISRHKKSLDRQHKLLKNRVLGLLENPARKDKVFQSLQRLFSDTSTDINLHRNHPDKFRIRKLAVKRFVLGYPPRKKDDTSIGDSLNWEWIVDCCARKKLNAIIVTRDTDFGQFILDNSFINDWLSLEFKERVGGRRQITLTNKLSFAFKEAISKRSVTREMESAEKQILIDTEIQKSEINKSIEEIGNLMTQEKLEHLRQLIKKYKSL